MAARCSVKAATTTVTSLAPIRIALASAETAQPIEWKAIAAATAWRAVARSSTWRGCMPRLNIAPSEAADAVGKKN